MKTAKQIIRERLKPFNIDIDYFILECLAFGMKEFADQALDNAANKIQQIDSSSPIADSLRAIYDVKSQL